MRLFLLLSIMLLHLGVRAQIIERSLIATDGGVQENGASISYSIGEPVNTYYLQSTHLCQGFQQSEIITTPLFVELLDFTAQRIDRENALINWEISTESEPDYFILERRDKGENDYRKVAEISSEELTVYAFTDKNDAIEQVYYRLAAVTKEGEKSYSEVREVEGTPLDFSFGISPNPGNETSRILVSPDTRYRGNYQVSLQNAEGQIIFEQTFTNAEAVSEIPLNRQRPGLYFISIQPDNHLRKTVRWVKVF